VTETRQAEIPLDLTPRTTSPPRRRRFVPVVLVAVIVVAIGALLLKTLGDASLFFRNVDQAVAMRDELGEKRFQLQGSVVPGTIVESELQGRPAVLFSVAYNGVALDVVHIGNPPELFKEGEAVVLEGRWTPGPGPGPDGRFVGGVNDGWYFSSDRMLAKHDATYVSEEKAQQREAERSGQVQDGQVPASVPASDLP
jgi:cytochrome c-type biogenesis protein CcmE